MRALLQLLLSLTAVASALKVKRVKAGMHYKKHDPVHVVVNKVGYVSRRLQYDMSLAVTARFEPVLSHH